MGFSFTTDTWSDFDRRTAAGAAPYHFKRLLPFSDGFATWEDAEAALLSLREPSTRELDCRIRIYLDETRRDDLVGSILDSEGQLTERLQTLVCRVSKSDRFSLLVNNFEQSSAKLAADFGQLVQSYFQARGFPIGGAEQVAFCGNYSVTPFGIHEGFEHALLCHLGPGTKHFYCWSQSTFVHATSGRAPIFSESKVYQDLLLNGTCFDLEPGDVLYLPASVYHIGRQESYSISVAIPLYTYPYERFLARGILPSLIARRFPFDEQGMSVLLPWKNSNPLVKPLSANLLSAFDHWLTNDLPKVSAFYWHRLRSNGGWELRRSIADNLLEDELLEPLAIRQGSRIEVPWPFLVSYEDGLDCGPADRRLFLAGRSVVVSTEVMDLTALSNALNARAKVEVDTPALAAIAGVLSRTGGLTVCCE